MKRDLNKQGVRNLNGKLPTVSDGVPVPVPAKEPFGDRQTPREMAFREDIMEYFTFDHLPAGPMREMSRRFAELAEHTHATAPRCAERSAALRKLLEGKDAAVRAVKPRK